MVAYYEIVLHPELFYHWLQLVPPNQINSLTIMDDGGRYYPTLTFISMVLACPALPKVKHLAFENGPGYAKAHLTGLSMEFFKHPPDLESLLVHNYNILPILKPITQLAPLERYTVDVLSYDSSVRATIQQSSSSALSRFVLRLNTFGAITSPYISSARTYQPSPDYDISLYPSPPRNSLLRRSSFLIF